MGGAPRQRNPLYYRPKDTWSTKTDISGTAVSATNTDSTTSRSLWVTMHHTVNPEHGTLRDVAGDTWAAGVFDTFEGALGRLRDLKMMHPPKANLSSAEWPCAYAYGNLRQTHSVPANGFQYPDEEGNIQTMWVEEDYERLGAFDPADYEVPEDDEDEDIKYEDVVVKESSEKKSRQQRKREKKKAQKQRKQEELAATGKGEGKAKTKGKGKKNRLPGRMME